MVGQATTESWGFAPKTTHVPATGLIKAAKMGKAPKYKGEEEGGESDAGESVSRLIRQNKNIKKKNKPGQVAF